MKRAAAVLVTAAAVLTLPAAAAAHVSLHPNEIPAGAFVTVNVRVPGEQPGAYAYKVEHADAAGLHRRRRREHPRLDAPTRRSRR